VDVFTAFSLGLSMVKGCASLAAFSSASCQTDS
jgi:hypothetical protein